jgi:hypothetical protein
VVTIVSGCYSPQLEGSCAVRCDLTATTEAARCPSGLTCAAGLCVDPAHPLCVVADANGPDCTMPAIHDDFESTLVAACGTWGTASSPSPTRQGGLLRMSPTIGMPMDFNCSSNGAFGFENGVFVAIPTPLPGPTTYTQIEVSDPGGNPLARVAIARDENSTPMLVLAVGQNNPLKSIDYIAAAMQWVRLRPIDGIGIAAEFASNPNSWTALGVVPGAPPAMVRASLGAGTYANTNANPGTAWFDNFDVCPL